MIPEQIKLTGFIGIRDGLGVDKIEINFTELLDRDDQLVAFSGPNGRGKTTLLDNMQPYRFMPSRSTSYSPSAFSFYDHIYGVSASKELVWSHDGDTYLSEFRFKMSESGKTKKTEAYLFRLVDAAAGAAPAKEPVALPDGTKSDGKTDTYDVCLTHILGSPELFFTAAFACQERRKLSEYANADIKTIMSDLLGLGHIRELGQKARAVVKLCKEKLAAVQERLRQLPGLEEQETELSVQIGRATADVECSRDDLKLAQAALDEARVRLTETEKASGQNAEYRRLREHIKERIAEVLRRMGADLGIVNEDLEREQSALLHVTQSAGARVEKLEEHIKQTRRAIARSEATLADAGAIEAAVAELPALEAELSRLAGEMETIDVEYRAHQEDGSRARLLSAEISGDQRHTTSIREKIDALTRRARLALDVPCAEMEINETCPLLADAREARDTVPPLETDWEQASDDVATKKRALDDLTSRLEAEKGIVERAQTVKHAKQALEQAARDTRERAAQAPMLATAREALEEASGRLEALESDRSDAVRKAEEEIGAIHDRIASLEARKHEIAAAAKADRKKLDQEWAEIPDGTEEQIVVARQKVDALSAQKESMEKTVDEARAELTAFQGQLGSIEHQIRGMDADRMLAAHVETEIAQWALLATALGNDGIIALSIDDAGPTISNIANELMKECYGPRFTLAIKTQRPTAAGEMREAFDVVVWDAESGESKSIRDMSGGQRVYLNEVLTRAIALFQSQISGQNYGTLFADESDGALDAEKKIEFTQMKRNVLEVGGYQREFFISHVPEIWDMADKHIDIASLVDGGR